MQHAFFRAMFGGKDGKRKNDRRYKRNRFRYGKEKNQARTPEDEGQAGEVSEIAITARAKMNDGGELLYYEGLAHNITKALEDQRNRVLRKAAGGMCHYLKRLSIRRFSPTRKKPTSTRRCSTYFSPIWEQGSQGSGKNSNFALVFGHKASLTNALVFSMIPPHTTSLLPKQ
jgi:hypothetical protein